MVVTYWYSCSFPDSAILKNTLWFIEYPLKLWEYSESEELEF